MTDQTLHYISSFLLSFTFVCFVEDGFNKMFTPVDNKNKQKDRITLFVVSAIIAIISVSIYNGLPNHQIVGVVVKTYSIVDNYNEGFLYRVVVTDSDGETHDLYTTHNTWMYINRGDLVNCTRGPLFSENIYNIKVINP